MASLRTWIMKRWPERGDLLLIDVVGLEKSLRAFMRRHPIELGMVRRNGNRMSFRGYVPANLRRELTLAAEHVTVVLNASDASRTIHSELILSSTSNRFTTGKMPVGVGLPTSVSDPLGYWSVDEVDSALKNLSAAFPTRTQRIELQHKTADGDRKCWALRISGPAVGGKKVLVLVGGIHGAEWGSCESLLNFATDLLTASETAGGQALKYGNQTFAAADVTAILDKMDIVVFPMVNPDGRAHSQATLDLWRKNRNRANSGGVEANIGVDLNRNFGFLDNYELAFDPSFFGTALRDPSDPCYAGPKGFSEPESRNVEWLLDQLPQDGWLLDFHSPWKTVLHPWGDDDIQNDDSTMSFRTPAHDGARGLRGDRTRAGDSGYREFMPAADQAELERLAGLVTTAMNGVDGGTYDQHPFFAYGTFFGTCVDYAYARQFGVPAKPKLLALHIEWGDNTVPNPDWSLMEGTFMPETVAGLVALCIGA